MSKNSNGPRLNEAVKTDIKNSVLCWLATVDQMGTPNVTPKEIFSYYGDDTLVIADIASTNSVRNLRAHPTACVSFIDIFRERGFKIVGTASILSPEQPEFGVVGAELLSMAGPNFPVRHVISIQIESISRIWAPSYKLLPEQTDEDRMQNAFRTYGVTPMAR
ncbi:MAG: pyridoxamine 5'-phosphate oxidase family protein [Rhizobiaceae bacterium]|nr:pyridoxamine 5'-phosphate oxidase family protein [Rhizobiaceae bacterium]